MQPLPHRYRVRASGSQSGDVRLRSESLPDLAAAPPTEFDGPGDRWSPETLLAAAVGSCLILTFRAVAQASRLGWNDLDCEVEATLAKGEGGASFTDFVLHATIAVPVGTDEDRVRRLLEKAKKSCMVTNSLRGDSRLEIEITPT